MEKGARLRKIRVLAKSPELGYASHIMLTTLIALVSIGAPAGELPICPVMGHELSNMKGPYSDYNGVRYTYCCGDCKVAFEKAPDKVAASLTKGKAAGIFLFDPVSGNRLKAEKAIKEYSDFQGVRFMFASAANKATFDQDPKKFGTLPEKEALYCPVGKEAVPTYGAASGYVDHAGVRYFLCCAGCEGPMKKEPEKLVDGAKASIKKPGIATEKAKP
jgi:YHS domain-containing protein